MMSGIFVSYCWQYHTIRCLAYVCSKPSRAQLQILTCQASGYHKCKAHRTNSVRVSSDLLDPAPSGTVVCFLKFDVLYVCCWHIYIGSRRRRVLNFRFQLVGQAAFTNARRNAQTALECLAILGSGNCRRSAVWLALARGCVRGLLMSEVLFSQLRPYVIIVARSMLDVLVIAIFQCIWYQAFVAMYHVCCQNLGVERCMSQNSR